MSAAVKYPTPKFLREMANEPMDPVPADVRDDVRATYRAAADALEQRGFYATPGMFLITEVKPRLAPVIDPPRPARYGRQT